MEVSLNLYFNLQKKFINGVYLIENPLILFQMVALLYWEIGAPNDAVFGSRQRYGT